jgi:anti-sigma B factor antagonist
MLDIKTGDNNIIYLSGRFDASQAEKAKKEFSSIDKSTTIDFSELEYISSAGLGILLMTQKRLMAGNHKLKLIGMSNHVREIFRYARFDVIFEIV